MVLFHILPWWEKNGTNGRVLRPLWAHVLATCLFSRLFFFRMAEPGAWIWKREVSPMAYGERWCRLIHELLILNGLRWQIRAINLDMPACFAGGAFIRARITHWRLVRSNEGKKQKQMGRSRRRKPLFRKWISFISACGFVWIGSCAKKTAISGCFQSGRCSRGNRIALLPWAFGLPSSENILLRPDPAKFSTLCPPR